jgi:CBS domain-containing protein/anti-sigma regulatory factor (Ser/Thr protein kinase)
MDARRERVVTDADAKNITRVQELAYELRIGEVMTRNLRLITTDMRMSDVMELFQEARISGAPVADAGSLIGIVSLADLIGALKASDLQAPVEKYMSRRVAVVKVYEPVIGALEMFAKTGMGRFPVVDAQGRLVGIITKGDITRGVLRALQTDYQAEEVRRYRASHLFEDIVSDRTTLTLRYWAPAGDFARGGKASSDIKRALLRLGASPQIARRCGIAIYEAEMNLIIHSTKGGVVWIEVEPQQILMKTMDDGPGIPDIGLAMQPGYSTASERVREMGFGAGMGLANIKRCVDEMSLESAVGKGTTLEMKIGLASQDSLRESDRAQKGEGAE